MMKQGLYYGPDNSDYTVFRDKAGRYTLAEAKERSERTGGDVTYIHADEAAEFAPGANPDRIIEYLLQQRDVLRQQVVEATIPVPSDTDIAALDQRMKDAGMVSLVDMLAGKLPTDRWAAHVGVSDIKSFGNWLESKDRQYTSMRVTYELGDEPKDSMYEWVLAHSGAYREVIANFRQAMERMAGQKAVGELQSE